MAHLGVDAQVMNSPLIAVLLSTYNGERYLEQQLESLWGQTLQDFELVVRDDGSCDRTLDFLRHLEAGQPGRVRLIIDDSGRVGPKASFAKLLSHTDAPYVAFCDQDDWWMPEKLERQHRAIATEEALYGGQTPVLCSSDAAVTDAELRITAPSYFAKHDFSVADGRDLVLPRLLFRNCAIGATTMINGALARRCRTMPDAAIMHDWWCALVATVIGRTVVLPQALMLYRQHGANVIGSKPFRQPRSVAEFRKKVGWAHETVARCVRQAQRLYAEFGEELSPRDRTVLGRFSNFGSQGALQRALTMIRARAFISGIALNGAYLVACMTAPVQSNEGKD